MPSFDGREDFGTRPNPVTRHLSEGKPSRWCVFGRLARLPALVPLCRFTNLQMLVEPRDNSSSGGAIDPVAIAEDFAERSFLNLYSPEKSGCDGNDDCGQGEDIQHA